MVLYGGYAQVVSEVQHFSGCPVVVVNPDVTGKGWICLRNSAVKSWSSFNSSYLADWGATIMFYIQSMVHVIFSSFTVEKGKKTAHKIFTQCFFLWTSVARVLSECDACLFTYGGLCSWFLPVFPIVCASVPAFIKDWMCTMCVCVAALWGPRLRYFN